MEIDGFKATIEYDPEIEMYRVPTEMYAGIAEPPLSYEPESGESTLDSKSPISLMRPHRISFKAAAQLLVMANGNLTGWRRIIKAFGFSMQGFKSCYKLEEAFRHEVWALVPLVPLGLWFGETPLERAMLVGSLLIIPIVELLNSAIEANVDRVGLERHELSGRAKDIASAAVFLSITFAVAIWGLLLIPKWM